MRLSKGFAGISFRESALFKDFAEVNLTFAFKNIFFRHFAGINFRALGVTEDFVGINFRELGFTEDFAGINFREFSLTKDFAGINFRESALYKDFTRVYLTFALRNIFLRP